MATASTFPSATIFTPFGLPPAQYLHSGTANTDSTMHLPIYSKEAATIAKIYTDSQKYNEVSDSFNFKLTIFYNICKRAGLPFKGYITTFPIMLKGLAQDHYYNNSLSTRLFTEACNYMHHFFEGLEYYWRNLIKWNATDFQRIIDKNPDKQIYQSFQLLLNKLLKYCYRLHLEFHTDLFFINKLVTAC